jgi:flagellar biosynthesis/type III secretory pathway protein FliH
MVEVKDEGNDTFRLICDNVFKIHMQQVAVGIIIDEMKELIKTELDGKNSLIRRKAVEAMKKAVAAAEISVRVGSIDVKLGEITDEEWDYR